MSSSRATPVLLLRQLARRFSASASAPPPNQLGGGFVASVSGGLGHAQKDKKKALRRDFIHESKVEERFLINYDSITQDVDRPNNLLKNPYLKAAECDTITKNVKNVQGWRGGAERGFLAVYPDLIHTLTKEGVLRWENEDLGMWFTKVLTHNLASEVVGKRYGILVPISYKQLHRDATKEEMNLAHRLGWGVELLRAANALANEIVGLRRRSSGEQTWAEKHNIDPVKAFNDVMILQNGFHIILKTYFREDPKYSFYSDAFMYSIRSSNIGRLLQFDNHPIHKKNFDGYTYEAYKNLVRHNVSNTNYILPVSLAMHMVGMNDSRVQEKARHIFELLGYFARLNLDYANHYLSTRHDDVRAGRMTWLNVLARQRLNAEERRILDDLYGKDDQASVDAVCQCYESLNMRRSVMRAIEGTREEIKSSIQQISKLDELGFSQEFVFALIESMDANEIA